VRFIGSIVDKIEEANALAEEMESTIKEIEDNTSSLNKSQMRKVYVEGSNLKTYGASSYCTESITKAGGINIYGDSPIKMPLASSEYVIEENPDNILLFVVAESYSEFLEKAENAINEVKGRPGWPEIVAVKNKKFCVIENRYLNFGPTHDRSIVAMGKFLYPELFSDISYPEFVYVTQG